MDVHASTAHRYLDEVFTGAVSAVSRRAAHRQTSIQSNFLNPLSEAIEKGVDADEEVVADLVNTFLIPEVERQRLKREDTVQTRRFASAAYDAVQTMFQGVQTQHEVRGWVMEKPEEEAKEDDEGEGTGAENDEGDENEQEEGDEANAADGGGDAPADTDAVAAPEQTAAATDDTDKPGGE